MDLGTAVTTLVLVTCAAVFALSLWKALHHQWSGRGTFAGLFGYTAVGIIACAAFVAVAVLTRHPWFALG